MNEVFKTTRTQAFEVDLPKFVPASGGTHLLLQDTLLRIIETYLMLIIINLIYLQHQHHLV
jgi:hypothetical protein